MLTTQCSMLNFIIALMLPYYRCLLTYLLRWGCILFEISTEHVFCQDALHHA